jgi:hypothetical protein
MKVSGSTLVSFSPLSLVTMFLPSISFRKDELPALLGRVTSDWRSLTIVSALAVDVIFVAVAFFSGSSLITVGGLTFVGFGLLFGARYVWKYQDMKSLQAVTKTLEKENRKLTDTRKRLNGEVDRLTVENCVYHRENTKFSHSNRLLTQNNKTFTNSNEILKNSNETFIRSNQILIQSNKTFSQQIADLNAFAVRIKEELSKENAAFAASVKHLNLNIDTLDVRFKEDLSLLETAIKAFNDEKQGLCLKLDQVKASLDELLTQKFFAHFSQESQELSTKIDRVNATFKELLDQDIYNKKMDYLIKTNEEIFTGQKNILALAQQHASIQEDHTKKLEEIGRKYAITQKAQEIAQTELQSLIDQIRDLKDREETLFKKNEILNTKLEETVGMLSQEVDRVQNFGSQIRVDS